MLGKVFRRYSNFWIFEDAGNSGGKTNGTERNFEKFRYTSQCCPLFLHSGKRYHWKAPCPAPLLPAKIQTKRRSNSPHMLPKRSEMVKIAMDTSRYILPLHCHSEHRESSLGTDVFSKPIRTLSCWRRFYCQNAVECLLFEHLNLPLHIIVICS